MAHKALSRLADFRRHRLLSVFPALLALTAVAVVVGQVAHPTAAKAAVDIVICNGSGQAKTTPAITTTPVNVRVDDKGQINLACTTVGHAGITSAKMAFTGTALAAVCEAVTEPIVGSLYVGAEAAGTLIVFWNGHANDWTLFNWVVAGATQVGPGVSVVAVTAASADGRFHGLLTPATLNILVNVTVEQNSCSAHDDTFDGTVTEFVMTDLL